MSSSIHNKILIIRFSSLGDIILTTPLLKILRKNFPESQIDYCTKKSYSEILRFNPNINNVIETSDELSFEELKILRRRFGKEKYDLIIDLHNNLRTFYLKLFLRFRTKVLTIKKYSFRKFLLVKFKINLMRELPPILQRYVDVLKTFQQGRGSLDRPYGLQPEIYTNDSASETINKLFNNLKIRGKLICIVPSSKHFTKTYPADSFIELINKFPNESYTFVLVGKGNDRINADKIKSSTGNNVHNLCNKLNLLELTELMKKCDLVITGDTGPMHIAEAVAVPIILLAGSSVKEFGFYPNFPPGREAGGGVLEISLPCRPCSHIGKDHCPKKHFKCMKNIRPEKIFEKVNEILKTNL